MSGARDHPTKADRPELAALTPDECRERLADSHIGRVVFVDARGPVALPVNYRVLDQDIVFRTAAFSSVLASSYVEWVGFEVDKIDESRHIGWSVLATGRIRVVDDETELRVLQELGVKPWAEGPRTQYLRLSVRDVTGRRLFVAPEGSAAPDSE
jgi:hypothetical protein